MTVIDKSISRQSKNLLLAFGGLVVVATTLFLVLTGSHEPTPSKTVKVQEQVIEDDVVEGDVKEWSDEKLQAFLKKRLVTPPDNITRTRLVELVESYRV